MPTTSDGETVYADPADVEEYVQTEPNQFSLSDSGSDPTEWRKFLEKIQVRMKSRIDEYVDREDFEDHPSDTVTLNGGPSPSLILHLPEPVRSVSEVRVDGEVLDASKYVVDDNQLIRLDPDGDAVEELADTEVEDAHWETGYGNIAVDLDWGYQTPPADIVEAELKLVAHTVTGLAQMREGMVVQQDDIDLQVALPEAMTTEVKNILRHHRSGGRSMGVI